MHNLAALITLLALLLYLVMTARVGMARGKFGIVAPAIAGHPEFERHFRVQANTGEWLLLFLPLLWLFSIYVSDVVAAGLGIIWLIGRALYMVGYVKAADKRSAGFGLQGLATLALLLGALGGVVMKLI